jgi:hypothetical protein
MVESGDAGKLGGLDAGKVGVEIPFPGKSSAAQWKGTSRRMLTGVARMLVIFTVFCYFQ